MLNLLCFPNNLGRDKNRANLFLSIPAQQAGTLLAGLENDVIAEILIKIPERRSAALLAQLPRDRGVKIAKLMAEFKNPAE